MAQPITDEKARQIEQLWKLSFPDASIFPIIGLPSNNKGVVTLTHTMGDGKLMTINGLASRSPLANNALYSSEVSNGRYLNLYEIMVPDVPGQNGQPSSGSRYVNALAANGLDVAGVHFHWFGGLMNGVNAVAVHHQNVGMDPLEFSRRTIQAIKSSMGQMTPTVPAENPRYSYFLGWN